jgi:hypothetical protein
MAVSEYGSGTCPALSFTESQMTQAGMCVMKADSSLVQTIECFNDIFEPFYNHLFKLYEIKYMLQKS